MFTSFYVNKKGIREKYTKDILDFEIFYYKAMSCKVC